MISNDQLNKLIDNHKMCGISAHRGGDKSALNFISEVIEALEELKQRRECELRPATKFIKSTFQEQLNHVKSEIKEIKESHGRVTGENKARGYYNEK